VTNGTTLIEALLGLVLLTLVAAIAVPEVGGQLDRLAVDHAVYQAVAAHRLARLKAVTSNGVTVLMIDPDSLRVRVLAGRDTAQSWSRPGPLQGGVSLTGPGRSLAFGPSGLARGVGNGTWRFARGRASKAIVISRLGRLRIVR